MTFVSVIAMQSPTFARKNERRGLLPTELKLTVCHCFVSVEHKNLPTRIAAPGRFSMIG